jgi:hypothetical protein
VQRSLARLFDHDIDRAVLADFVVRCGDASFAVHQLVLLRAPYFATMLSAGLSEAKEKY